MVDELKTLVEAVNAVSGDAKDVLICWIVVEATKAFITALTTAGCIWLVLNLFRYLIKSVCGSERLLRAFGKNTECWHETDLQRACKILSDASK